ncbi:conserved hypothetical protein [Sporisorium reilianum SRZ2]|uniref:Uncharacterized protein n=1 Tax=Sporisorium reilianum (strain SRZ2) TaxID=999809 RepID=E7A2S9_SPORE|nr:conserved hypothetical protein [Sporisorium reilianum SRZ2]
MVAALPVEIVDLILRHSLHHDARKAAPPIDTRQAATLSALSRRYHDVFQPDLYRYVTLLSAAALRLFARTLGARPQLGTHVRSLAILCTDDAESGGGGDTVADAVLQACVGATHLLLECAQFRALARALYALHRPAELTLVNVTRADDVLGIVTRHRDLTAASLQANPRIQALLGSSTPSILAQEQAALAPRAEHSLSHLHLVHFDARLLHRLVTLSSLTHVVLTHPHVPERRPGAPGLAVIPRSHLMLLLGSGNIARVMVRADLATCVRIMEEIAPIEDRKLVFRPVSTEAAGVASRSTQAVGARLGGEAAALYDSVHASDVDLLAEFDARLRPRTRSRAAAAEDADTSRDSSGRTSHGRSSDSSARTTTSSGSASGSGTGSTGSGDDDTERRQPDDDPPSSSSASSSSSDSDNEAPFPAHARSTTAPPLNIPIEELLRSERFTPAGLVAPSHAPSSPASSATEHTSSASARTASHTRRPRRASRTTPFSLRKTDLRGATLANIELCSAVLDAFGEGEGDGGARETGRGFW